MSSLFLPTKIRGRAIMGSIVVTLGLGLYLLGGNVVERAILGTIVTFFVAVNLCFLCSWSVGGPIALTLMMIFTAGLNAGSPEKTTYNFVAFALVMLWSTAVSMLPFWKPLPAPEIDPKLTDTDYAEQGLRMGIGSSIALGASYLFNFNMIGWAPSAVGHIVRYNPDETRMHARGRTIGTIIGSAIAIIVLALIRNAVVVVYAGAIFAVINGLYKNSKLADVPVFYTATILLLYSVNDLPSGYSLALQRVAYNLIGILVGVFVALYPFPKLIKRLRAD